MFSPELAGVREAEVVAGEPVQLHTQKGEEPSDVLCESNLKNMCCGMSQNIMGWGWSRTTAFRQVLTTKCFSNTLLAESTMSAEGSVGWRGEYLGGLARANSSSVTNLKWRSGGYGSLWSAQGESSEAKTSTYSWSRTYMWDQAKGLIDN